MYVIDGIITWIKNRHAKLLVYLYRHYNRHQSSRVRSGFEITNEFYCREIEALTIYIPKQKDPSRLITKYLSLRFSPKMRCIIKHNGREISRMAIDTPEDISRRDDFIYKNCYIHIANRDIQKLENKKASERKNSIPIKRTQEDPQVSAPSKELKFSDAGKQEYLKEKEETSVLLNRVASMNTSKADVPDNVEKFILAQFTEENGFTVDVACIHSGLREQFNIMWAQSTIDKINAKYWDILKGSLITNSEDEKYHIRKEQLDIINHE